MLCIKMLEAVFEWSRVLRIQSTQSLRRIKQNLCWFSSKTDLIFTDSTEFSTQCKKNYEVVASLIGTTLKCGFSVK